MAQNPTRLNLASTSFPFLSEFSGRGIIVKQSDQNYVPSTVSKEDLDKDIGIPQLFYCHNIMATGQGYLSVAYVNQIFGLGGSVQFIDIIPVIDDAGHKAYLGWTTAGDIFMALNPSFNSWMFIQNIPLFATKEVSYCVVNGKTYIYVATLGAYVFDFTTNNLVSQTLTGITPSSVLGIFACQGYMLVYSTNSILWSSLVDPTDFTPSLTTGAGGGAVQNIRGDIVCVVPHTTGFVVYTNQNAVAANSSNNTRYPFNFRELVASGGVFSKSLITYDANTGSHYAYTTSGLQLISLQQSQTTLPELTDFIAGAVFEDFDEVNKVINVTHLTTPMKKRLVIVADRYLVISYGVSSLTHALIYDIITKRWSKLKVPHVSCFEFSLLQAETTTESPRRSLAFLQADGKVVTAKFDTRDMTSVGVLILGKIQYIRQRVTSLFSVTIENVQPEATFTLQDWYTLDGKTMNKKDGYCTSTLHQVREFLFNQVGVNHSLLFMGTFNLVSVVIMTGVHGRR